MKRASIFELDGADRVLLMQSSLVIAALTTLLELFPIRKKNGFHIGAKLPVIMGISFAYVPSMQAIAGELGVGAILGAQFIGGIVAIIVGFSVNKIQKFFPPLITGTVVFTIGLSLYPVAVNYMAGGLGSPTYGSPLNWGIALLTLAVVTGFNHFAKGIAKLSSILIGMTVGYIAAILCGIVDFSLVVNASAFSLPKPLHFGLNFDIASCVAIGLLFAIIPQCVLGGATISVFASISMTGLRLIDKEKSDFRNSSIVGLSVALGMGIYQYKQALALFPAWTTTIFGNSPVVVATIMAIFLNIILPKNNK